MPDELGGVPGIGLPRELLDILLRNIGGISRGVAPRREDFFDVLSRARLPRNVIIPGGGIPGVTTPTFTGKDIQLERRPQGPPQTEGEELIAPQPRRRSRAEALLTLAAPLLAAGLQATAAGIAAPRRHRNRAFRSTLLSGAAGALQQQAARPALERQRQQEETQKAIELAERLRRLRARGQIVRAIDPETGEEAYFDVNTGEKLPFKPPPKKSRGAPFGRGEARKVAEPEKIVPRIGPGEFGRVVTAQPGEEVEEIVNLETGRTEPLTREVVEPAPQLGAPSVIGDLIRPQPRRVAVPFVRPRPEPNRTPKLQKSTTRDERGVERDVFVDTNPNSETFEQQFTPDTEITRQPRPRPKPAGERKAQEEQVIEETAGDYLVEGTNDADRALAALEKDLRDPNVDPDLRRLASKIRQRIRERVRGAGRKRSRVDEILGGEQPPAE